LWKSYIANNKLFIVLLFSFLGNVLAWLHMNAQFKWDWAKETWWIILGGVPISFLFYYSTRLSYEHFGQYWAIRPLGFGMATITFGILTAVFLKEIPSLKIWISLLLALAIIILNVSNSLDEMQ